AGPHPVRGGQQWLGRDHPPLAPTDHQLRGRQSPPRLGGEGPNPHRTRRGQDRLVPRRTLREPDRREVPLLIRPGPAVRPAPIAPPQRCSPEVSMPRDPAAPMPRHRFAYRAAFLFTLAPLFLALPIGC